MKVDLQVDSDNYNVVHKKKGRRRRPLSFTIYDNNKTTTTPFIRNSDKTTLSTSGSSTAATSTFTQSSHFIPSFQKKSGESPKESQTKKVIQFTE